MNTIHCQNCKGKGIIHPNDQFNCPVCMGKGSYETILLFRYFDCLGPNCIQLRCDSFETIKHTPSGYWIDWGHKNKFITKYTDKRWAYDTMDAAFASYLRRKKKQIKILKAQLERAELAVTLTPANPNSDGSPYQSTDDFL